MVVLPLPLEKLVLKASGSPVEWLCWLCMLSPCIPRVCVSDDVLAAKLCAEALGLKKKLRARLAVPVVPS